MKIVKLVAENVKRLHAVQITPQGNVVEIRGRNGAGKSSVLDAIWMALGGRSASPEEPIRAGQAEASATVNLGSLIVKRTWTRKGTYLSVTTAQGQALKSPQAVLDELKSHLTFDPLEFARLPAVDQRERLLALLHVDEKLAELDRAESENYAARREATKCMNQHSAAADAITLPDDTPTEPIDVGAVAEQLNEAHRLATQIDVAEREVEQLAERVRNKRKFVDDVTDQINTVRASLEALLRQLETAKSDQSYAEQQHEERHAQVQHMARPDVTVLQQKLQSAQRVNAMVERRREMEAHKRRAADYAEQVEVAACALENARNERKRLLHDANWPVDGLSVSADTVLFKGVPFAQCSASEKLHVSVRIAMAMNPTLRVLLVRDGSLLDEQSIETLYREVAEADYQLWIERVGDESEVGVVIEEGHVRGAEEREAGLFGAGTEEAREPEGERSDDSGGAV